MAPTNAETGEPAHFNYPDGLKNVYPQIRRFLNDRRIEPRRTPPNDGHEITDQRQIFFNFPYLYSVYRLFYP